MESSATRSLPALTSHLGKLDPCRMSHPPEPKPGELSIVADSTVFLCGAAAAWRTSLFSLGIAGIRPYTGKAQHAMKSLGALVLVALAAREAAGHAMFQDLWVDGTDMGSQCVRMPRSNTPVTNVGSPDLRCNAGTRPVNAKCPVKAGSTVTIEMHQQPGDRSCGSEAIGGAHYGPVMAYLTKVPDATTADGSTGWFKIFQDSWEKKAGGGSGDDDYWGTKDLNTCCGKMDVKIPEDIPDGDYLLRAEAIALHTAGSAGGAQLYMSCYQITVTGGGSASPDLVKLPGAYKASDPGLLVNIHAPLSTYIAPGPTVYAGGSVKTAGSSCGAGCAGQCKVGQGASGTAISVKPVATAAAGSGSAAPAGAAACTVQQYGQCGGNGYTGCTTCAAGLTCRDMGGGYYSQCV
ncbi:hypothetical protein VTK73DRAFT_5739 [Phialemonium thermophilum]|uniref:lytic cellulose monooxygenase (C4-dehydrogenating) n=1 Tax=Phialemonium thermophilum TaxID=223376 RepID=A0ABR3WLY2_9PEZI